MCRIYVSQNRRSVCEKSESFSPKGGCGARLYAHYKGIYESKFRPHCMHPRLQCVPFDHVCAATLSGKVPKILQVKYICSAKTICEERRLRVYRYRNVACESCCSYHRNHCKSSLQFFRLLVLCWFISACTTLNEGEFWIRLASCSPPSLGSTSDSFIQLDAYDCSLIYRTALPNMPGRMSSWP